jgi:predicted nucleic acid-binding protein
VRLVVDTGVFSAALARRPRPDFEAAVDRLAGNQLFLAVQTVAELRYGGLVAGWAERRLARLETAIAAATVLPVTDDLLHVVARVRHACRAHGHPLADRIHHSDLWIAAAAVDSETALLTVDKVFRGVPGLALA